MWSKIKDIITDILGLGIFCLSIELWYVERLTMIEAISMMLFGSLFFLVSDASLGKTLTVKFGKFLDTLIGRFKSKDDSD